MKFTIDNGNYRAVIKEGLAGSFGVLYYLPQFSVSNPVGSAGCQYFTLEEAAKAALDRVLEQAEESRCCRACHGSGVETDENGVQNKPCPDCSGDGLAVEPWAPLTATLATIWLMDRATTAGVTSARTTRASTAETVRAARVFTGLMGPTRSLSCALAAWRFEPANPVRWRTEPVRTFQYSKTHT